MQNFVSGNTQSFALISASMSALFETVTNGDKVQAAQSHTSKWTELSSRKTNIWNIFGKARL